MTVGNHLINDVIIPKVGTLHGTQFGIINQDGKLSIRDFTSLDMASFSSFKIPANEKTPVHAGQVVNFGNSMVYSVDQTGANSVYTFIGHSAPLAKDYPIVQTIPGKPVPAEGLKLGRLKKNDITITNSAISGSHGEIHQDGLVDAASTNGTFIYLRSAEEFKKGHQSGPVAFNKQLNVNFNALEVKIE